MNDSPLIESFLDGIAEVLVLEDLNVPATREKAVRLFSVLTDELQAECPVGAEYCRQGVTICQSDAASGSAKELEKLLASLRDEYHGRNNAAPAPAESSNGTDNNTLPAGCDIELLRDFLVEGREHLETADAQLLILEHAPDNDEAVNTVFRAFHTIKGVAGFMGLETIQKVAHESESLLDKARNHVLQLAGAAVDATFESVDTLKKLFQNLDAATKGNKAEHHVVIEPLLERVRAASNGNVSAPTKVMARVEPSAPEPKANTEVAGINVAVTPPVAPPVAPAKPKAPAISSQSAPAISAPASAPIVKAAPVADGGPVREVLKVDAERLERLVDMIGELVIAESMVIQSEELQNASSNLTRQLGQLDKITRELQEIGTSLRMVPVRATFQKMARLVRDLAKKSGKQVDFIMTGEDTELDKTVVEKIGDPLIHMVRNSVDHGLENDSEARLKAGKPAAGRVELKAYHRGGNIYIEIVDDGRGLNKDAILAKAIERGLVKDGEELSEREIFNLIFAPGLSTAKTVTDVSGRGVGMDVVRRNIESLRGEIEIQSKPGVGTTFIIRLPLTLAIIDGMIVRAGNERYIIPTLSIVRSIRPAESDLETMLGRGEMIKLQGHLIPIFRLHRLFDIANCEHELCKGLIVIVEDAGRRVGVFADELLGQQQTVIKSLGGNMRNLSGLSGGAIMPDGNVGLILDVAGLIKVAHAEQKTNFESNRQAAPVLQAIA